LIAAVPALVNCAVPSRWMPVQYVAVASQKFTVPVVTAVVPEVTVAVSFTTLGQFTEVTGLPPEVTASVVMEFAIGGSVNVAVAVADDDPATTAMAFRVSVELTVIAPVYTVDGVLPLVE